MMKKKKKKKVDLEDFENIASAEPETETNKENETLEATEETQSKKKDAGINVLHYWSDKLAVLKPSYLFLTLMKCHANILAGPNELKELMDKIHMTMSNKEIVM